MFWFVEPLETLATDGALYLLHGVLIAVSTCGLTLGPRYISATEVSLLILLESVFAPILAWLVLSEIPAQSTIIGGFFILSALVVYNIIIIQRRI